MHERMNKGAGRLGQEVAVYPARLFRWASVIVATGLAVFCTYRLMLPLDTYHRIATGIMLAISLPGAIYGIYSIRRPQRIATFTPASVVDALGNEWAWHEIRDLGNNLGTFRVRVRSPHKVEIRLDPAIVGWTKIAEVKAFLKQNAPPELTARL